MRLLCRIGLHRWEHAREFLVFRSGLAGWRCCRKCGFEQERPIGKGWKTIKLGWKGNTDER